MQRGKDDMAVCAPNECFQSLFTPTKDKNKCAQKGSN